MKNKAPVWAMPVSTVMVLAISMSAIGQENRLPAHFSGLIDDYTPSTVKGGPYEMHGSWSLDLHRSENLRWILHLGQSLCPAYRRKTNERRGDQSQQEPRP